MARYIDADRLISEFTGNGGVFVYGINVIKAIVSRVNKQPTADVVEVVRCKNCKYYIVEELACFYPRHNGIIGIDGFCSYGERRTL